MTSSHTTRPQQRLHLLRSLMCSIALLVTLSAASAPSFAQIAIIVGAKSPVGPLSKDQAAALFLGQSLQLPNGNLPLLFDQHNNIELRTQFYQKLTSKSLTQVKALWSRLVFSGKAFPPKEIGNSDDLKKLVANNPDAMGYVEKSAVDSTVKVVLMLE
jgi:ABC-type phosphate transport system substrate-binding protein